MSDEIKRIDIAEFRAAGYLQEVNRRFFHPLGLALEIVVDDDTGSARLGGVWDYRDDPEGILYGPDQLDAEKAAAVDAEWNRRQDARIALTGHMVQPAQ